MSEGITWGGVYTEEPATIEDMPDMSSTASGQHHRANSTIASKNPDTPLAQKWSAEEWSEMVLGQQPVQASHTKLQNRVKEFLVHANDQERDELEQSRQQLLEMIQEARAARSQANPDTKDASLKTKIKHAWSSSSGIAYQYFQMLDPMIDQAPGYVSVAFGAIKIILTVQINYQELKEKMTQYLDQISTRFELIDHLTAYIPTKRLVDHLARAYQSFTKFLSKAVKYYTQSRVKTYLKAVLKPWDRFQKLVDDIGQTFVVIERIAQLHGLLAVHANLEVGQEALALIKSQCRKVDANNVMLENVLSQLHAISVQFTKEKDIRETASLVREHVDQRQDDPRRSQCTTSVSISDSTDNFQPNLLDQLGGLFAHLKTYNEETLREKHAIEETSEMRSHRSTQRNLLRSEKVLSWIETDVSQILWVEGNNVLQRSVFNASFAIPLLVMGEGSYESTLVLRHFCGDIGMARKPSTLVQALLYQVIERNPDLLRKRKDIFTQEKALNTQAFWGLLLECLDDVKPDCTFIIIDSFDNLEEGEPEDEGAVITYLDNLVRDKTKLVKVLLTASLAQPLPDEYHALVDQHPPHRGARRLSTIVIEDQAPLISHQLVEIQERRCKVVSFPETPFLYPSGSIIYEKEGDHWRAFTVVELSGMNPEPFGSFAPLKIRAWSVDHNGKYFARKYHDLTIHRFSGRRAITSLKFIPAGFLPEEGSVRKELIRRGRKYWELGSSVNYKQFNNQGHAPVRVVIDQKVRPLELPAHEFAEQFRPTPASELRPQILMTCPPVIDAYLLPELRWSVVEVDKIHEVVADESRSFNNLMIDDGTRQILRGLVKGQEAFDSDFTNDIGRPLAMGTTVLLHGPPGCGKTFSVECLAETIMRPLLRLTHASLGESVHDLVKSLEEAFRLSDRWDCIILFDDVNSLFSPRKDDMSQNIRITLFMQLTETHNGLLFLTTNQVGMLDEAFLSRVQIKLYYPGFAWDMAHRMLENCLNSIKERAHKDKSHIKIETDDILLCMHGIMESGRATYNGRDIVNLCQTALLLAKHETQEDLSLAEFDSVVVLKGVHFKTVSNMTMTYEKYVKLTREHHSRTRDPGGQQDRSARSDTFGSSDAQSSYERYSGGYDRYTCHRMQ